MKTLTDEVRLFSGLSRQEREWEDLARLDPLWAILSDHDKKFGGWNINEFFQTGADEISAILSSAQELGRPLEFGAALDFGCGVGRLCRPLKSYFQRCVGVDISISMINMARRLNPDCQFMLEDGPKMAGLAMERFDFIYSNIVLQHQPSRSVVLAYIEQFLRILKPGGILVFQLPHHIPLKRRLQPRRRAYRVLRSLNISADFLYRKLGLNPITMLAIREETLTRAIRDMQGNILHVKADKHGGPDIESRTYFVSL
jgi:SAM-dependent methyltransferase